jgi:hypothetical protein
MRKIAVTLNQLRKASKAMSGKVVRRHLRVNDRGFTLGPSGTPVGPAAINTTAEKTNVTGKAFIKGDSGRFLRRNSEAASKGLTRVLPDIAEYGRPGDVATARTAILDNSALASGLKRLSPRGREAVNRSVILHEGAELKVKKKNFAPSHGHLSMAPPLNDLNIAATLKGPGSDAASSLRRLRAPEKREIDRAIPGLDLGKERVSRHAIKRISEIMKRKQQG